MSDEKRTNSLKGKLTAKQERFVQEYLIDLTATAAYKRAGYKCTGDAATSAAQQILGNIRVKAAIDAALAERSKRTEITIDLVVQETWLNYQRCVAAEEFGAANKSLELLGRHTGAFPNKLLHAGVKGGNIIVEFARAEKRPDSDLEPATG
jgi:Terminase small subunit